MHQKLQFIFVRTVFNLRIFKYSQPFLFSQIEITLQFGPGYLSPSHAVYMSTDILEHRIFGESLAFFKIKPTLHCRAVIIKMSTRTEVCTN